MTWMGWLLAQVPRSDKDPLRQPEVIWGTVALSVALLVGALIIWSVDRWRKRLTSKPIYDDELSEYRQLLERGEITEEEYERLRAKVSQRLRSHLGMTTAPPTTTTPRNDPPGPITPPQPPATTS
jgi:hypothetical protein